jgi:hypothetical protein
VIDMRQKYKISNEKHFELQRSHLNDKNVLIFEKSHGFDQAIKDGFFLIKIPHAIDLTPGDIFAQNFYKQNTPNNSVDNIYCGYSKYTPDKFPTPHEGYYIRETDQTEQFFLEKKYWQDIYPPALVSLANSLNELAIIILKNVLTHVGISEELWPKATGECSNNNGTHHLTFNHFRPEKNTRGLNVHKDSGWVTVLRSLEPGLEAFIEDTWVKINPVNGYFIVNFGCALEILTKHLAKPVAAIVHRVVQQYKKDPRQYDRFSYALFTDNNLDVRISAGLYEYQPNTGLNKKVVFKKFLDNILHDTYNEKTVGLYEELSS